MPFPSLLIAQTKSTKLEISFLVVLVIVASVVRFWDLGYIGFNNDEAIYSGQAATLAGFEEYGEHFSIFRAHPLLVQYFVSILFGNFGISDTIARIVPAIFGIFAVIITYMVGRNLYDRRIAMISALVVTILPYHILISRQVLLDISLSCFYTLTLFFVSQYLSRKEGYWLYFVGVSAGLTFMSKEVGIFALIVSLLCLFLIKSLNRKNILVIISTFLLTSSPFWIPVLIIPDARDASLSYWNWQTSRDPNQDYDFYFTMITQESLGYVLTGLFALSVIYSFVSKNIKKPTVFIPLVWIAVPLIIFQVLSVKGFAFTVAVVPVFVLMGISFLFSDWMKKVPHYRIVIIAIIPLIFIFSGPMLHYMFQIPPTNLVGSTGGELYAREAATWIRDNVDQKGVYLTVATRTANLIMYYSNNDAIALHANNNPAYKRIDSADLPILNGKINYLVNEPYLVELFPYLRQDSREINNLVIKYNAIPIHTEYGTYVDNSGRNIVKPAIIIYSLQNTK